MYAVYIIKLQLLSRMTVKSWLNSISLYYS